ncbi:MAG: DHA2 family efflux MFS transporter permease subunit, partial [Rhodospirillaceae bacterium]|nr:DHA2 family efflux MFS transporter permease subunit [Rhodospirillales bacterium]
GWLARVFSTRWLFFVSATTFTLASALCAFAWNIESMIVLRALQGFLGGAMIPTVFATAFTLFPPRMSAGVSVLIGLVATMAPTLGPTLGGWLTDISNWHWLFLINVVPGLMVAFIVLTFVDFDRPRLHLLSGFDLAGVVLIALFLGSMQYVLEEGPREDWFQDRGIVAFTTLMAVAGMAFVWRELTYDHPVVELRAFADRNFLVGCIFSFVIGIGLYGSVYVVPLFLGRVRGYSSLEIGITMMVTGLFQFLSAPLAGNLARHMDLRVMLSMGLGLFGAGLWLNSFLTSEWGYWEMFLPQAVRGLSLMFCMVPINNVALGHLPPTKVQNASGLFNLMRNTGGAVGLAAITTALSHRADLHLARLSERITEGNLEAVTRLQNMSARFADLIPGDPDQAALRALLRTVKQQALTMAYGDVLLGMSLVFVCGLMLMPFVHKVSAPGGGGGH